MYRDYYYIRKMYYNACYDIIVVMDFNHRELHVITYRLHIKTKYKVAQLQNIALYALHS